MKKLTFVFIVLGFAYSSFGQKNILIEKFTNLYCGSCPDKSILLTNLEQEYPQLIWISHYWPASFEYNPLPYPGAEQMWEEVGIGGTPNAIVDRTPYNGQLGSGAGNWETRIQQQVDLESYVDIEFGNINFDENNRQLTFEVTSKFHTLPTDVENFSVIVYVTEDNVIWRQHSYYNNSPGHPLEGLGDVIQDYSHQNLLRELLNGGWGDENIIPNNPVIGEEYVQTFSYQVPDMYNHINFELTAAVTEYHETDFKQRPVLNAERIALENFIISSTNETELSNFNAFPNPAKGVINLQFKEQPTQLNLVDMKGIQIKQYAVTGLDAQIDLNNIPAGQYILQVLNGDQMISQKIVIE